jgi:predicted flap endonuclease-1-like 5' DNA nuclease
MNLARYKYEKAFLSQSVRKSFAHFSEKHLRRTEISFNHFIAIQIHAESEDAMRLIRVEGIGPSYANKLAQVGIRTTDQLLAEGATRQGRTKISESSGISYKLILSWVNIADLVRIPGIGEEYSDLLEESGINTVLELRNRKPAHLHARLIETNAQKKLVRRVPSLSKVKSWIRHAKKLRRAIYY